MKKLSLLSAIVISQTLVAQNVGIGTIMPQATLDVKGNQRVGGAVHFTTYDSVGGKIEWRNSSLYVPISQYLMQHSAAADGLYYNNNTPISGQLEYRNALGNPVFYTNFINGNGYFKGRLGISTINPLAGLHVTDSSVLFSADGNIPGPPVMPPVQGSGRRMMWYPDKAAFRVGHVYNDEWNLINIGNYSFASGNGTKASGELSTAMGSFTIASGYRSTAMGSFAYATGNFSTAMGGNTQASGGHSIAMGNSTIASGETSTAIGFGTNASGAYSTAIGYNTTATGIHSTTMGYSTTAKSDYETVLGSWNTDYTPLNTTGWNNADRLFTIGNGNGPLSTSDAITVLKNGKTGIGTSTPLANLHVFSGASGNITPFSPLVVEGSHNTYINLLSPNLNETAILFGKAENAASGGIVYNNAGNLNGFQFRANGNVTRMEIYSSGNAWLQGTLNQNSDRRLKKDIHQLQNCLQKITKLSGYNYYWKDDKADNNLQTGVLAQEVQKLFPQLVREGRDGMLSVNYSGLIPVLIESIKEQQTQMKEQQKQIDELKKLVEKLLKQ